MRRGALGGVAVCALLACSNEASEPDAATIVVRGETKGLEWSPASAVVAARRTPFGVELDVIAPLSLRAPRACSADVSPDGARQVELRPWIRVKGGDLSQLGFDAPFALTVEPGCRQAIAGRIAWRQVDGAPVKLQLHQNGFAASGRTPKLELAGLPRGIVPLSPRTRGKLSFELTWQGGGREIATTVELAAAARATGLPSVAPGQRVLLGGEGWRVRERPKGAQARVEPHAGAAALRPDVLGRWLLEDASGETLSIAVGTHAGAALDCGRSDCHRSAAEHAATSAMTSVYARGLGGALEGWDASCVVGCHTVGEPGLDDGGFADVLAELGRSVPPVPGERAWAELPRALRRLAGVGCTACHGPGAIPEPSASWAILRSDVCAVCHDAPPRYPHVARWSSTRMARADANATTRSRPECRRCHTSAGFVGREAAPEHAIGLGCATCHAPHAPERAKKLVRAVALPAGFPDLPASAAASRVCVPCHASPAGAAEIVFGAPHPHASIGGGCIGCHGAPRDARGRLDHAFGVDRATCAGCHPNGADERAIGGATIQERARALWKRLGGGAARGPLPPHAQDGAPADGAARLVRQVLEDPAAATHNAARARALLDEVEKQLANARSP